MEMHRACKVCMSYIFHTYVYSQLECICTEATIQVYTPWNRGGGAHRTVLSVHKQYCEVCQHMSIIYSNFNEVYQFSYHWIFHKTTFALHIIFYLFSCIVSTPLCVISSPCWYQSTVVYMYHSDGSIHCELWGEYLCVIIYKGVLGYKARFEFCL